jgi:hypothetical protein
LKTTRTTGMRGVRRAVVTCRSAGLFAHRTTSAGLDVEVHHIEKAQQLKFAGVKVVESGPLFASVETELKYNKSIIKVTVSSGPDGLTRNNPSSNARFIRSRWMPLKVGPVSISHMILLIKITSAAPLPIQPICFQRRGRLARAPRTFEVYVIGGCTV